MKEFHLPLFVKEVYQRSDDDSSLNKLLRKNENEFEYDSEMKYFMRKVVGKMHKKVNKKVSWKIKYKIMINYRKGYWSLLIGEKSLRKAGTLFAFIS